MRLREIQDVIEKIEQEIEDYYETHFPECLPITDPKEVQELNTARSRLRSRLFIESGVISDVVWKVYTIGKLKGISCDSACFIKITGDYFEKRITHGNYRGISFVLVQLDGRIHLRCNEIARLLKMLPGRVTFDFSVLDRKIKALEDFKRDLIRSNGVTDKFKTG